MISSSIGSSILFNNFLAFFSNASHFKSNNVYLDLITILVIFPSPTLLELKANPKRKASGSVIEEIISLCLPNNNPFLIKKNSIEI